MLNRPRVYLSRALSTRRSADLCVTIDEPKGLRAIVTPNRLILSAYAHLILHFLKGHEL